MLCDMFFLIHEYARMYGFASTGLMSPMTLADAWALHQRISPDRWCVTRRELYAFVAEVRQLWLNGAIPNNRDRPNPVHDDAEHGPNLYLGISWNTRYCTFDVYKSLPFTCS